MPPISIAASFWRGGTSQGLLLRAETLAPFPPAIRERIIKTAIGSPDPAGRQIDGLGGGVSSLSKVAILSAPGEGKSDQEQYGLLPGVEWADQGHKDGKPYDLIYRFGQVPIRTDDPIDWTASCGNMVSAAALSALTTSILPYTTLFLRSRELRRPSEGDLNSPIMFPLSILSASNGVLMKAHIPIDPVSLQVWEPRVGEGCEIAGVPGKDEPGIEVEMPLDLGEGGLVTGRTKDTVELEDGTKITVSILSSGLPNIFVPVSSLLSIPHLSSLPSNLLTLSTSELLSLPDLASTLSTIRTRAALQHNLPLSLASPKITLISSIPSEGYTTSSGSTVKQDEADLLVRAVSSGDWHATIPGTTLGALNIGLGTKCTVIHDTVDPSGGEMGEKVTVRAGHNAGVAESTVRFSKETGKPESVVMLRTAREIMSGNVMIPERVFR
ncbi:uncharacterized protein JCM6883_001899 [Sporobolomyces salmoneus]|uniref:uncharacterized protein n=1 Tax=Sporobolomyces salmoneus TaxID=183962 RepID=UPI00317164C5